MKTSILIFFLILSQAAQGQESNLSKQERKALIKQAKMYKSNPEKLRALNLKLENFELQLSRLNEQLTAAEDETTSRQVQVEDLRRQLRNANDKLALQNEKALTNSKPITIEPSLVFKVQIGGYRKRDLSEFADIERKYINTEVNAKGIQEITLGYFDSYDKADQFKKHLRAMGLKDAWIVPFKDGRRVPLKDVLSEAFPSGKRQVVQN